MNQQLKQKTTYWSIEEIERINGIAESLKITFSQCVRKLTTDFLTILNEELNDKD